MDFSETSALVLLPMFVEKIQGSLKSDKDEGSAVDRNVGNCSSKDTALYLRNNNRSHNYTHKDWL